MSNLINKLDNLTTALKSIDNLLSYSRASLLSIKACVRMDTIQADDEDTSTIDLDFGIEQNIKNSERSTDLESYNDLRSSSDG